MLTASKETTPVEAESRDSVSTTPPPPPSILEKSVSTESVSSSPHHHVKIKCPGIPPISPRAHHKERNHSFKGLSSSLSSNSPRKDRSVSLGAYPPSWRDLSSATMPPLAPPIVPYSPSASPITSTSLYAPDNISAANSMLPCMPHLSHSHQTRAAMEAAVHSERERTKKKQQEEENMTADELRLVLKQERIRMSKIQADLAAMRAAAVQCQAEAEVHEEGRINNLMRRVECLQQEKGRIIVELEREEEMLTNTLQKKLDQVKREKALLEQQIEREESSHGKLKTKLTSMMRTDKNQTMEKPKSDSNDNHKGTNHDSMVHSATILESEDEEAENE